MRRALIIFFALAASVVLAVQIARFFHQEDDAKVVRDFFVDDASLAFETHGTAETPPLAGTRPGSTIVIAKCFNVDGQQVIAWLERYKPAMKARLDEAWATHTVTLGLLMSSRAQLEVRLPAAGSPWLEASSPEGKAIVLNLPKGRDGIPGMPMQPE